MIPWKTWSRIPLVTFPIFLIIVPVGGQDLDYYLDLANQGKVEEVAAALPQLYREHPNDGSILYLEGLITQDGDAAIEMFKRVAQLYPSSPYADDALLKIGEYLYARGLYIQATQYLKRIPVHHPRSDLIYPSIRLFLNALLVAGNRDTALFYTQVFSRKYPDIQFDLEAGKASDTQASPSISGLRSAAESTKESEGISRREREGIRAAQPEPEFRLQAGAFSVRENAMRRKQVLESLNYRVRITRTRSGERLLYLVMIEGFASREEAEATGRLLEENYDIDCFLVQGK
ncbi:MAG: SPOR domain-containing protein [Fidelibacterota bacterium]|nr:MAG: SPOR domain-containing protein [Candidatus Neomarinimicrobiota bacterium]